MSSDFGGAVYSLELKTTLNQGLDCRETTLTQVFRFMLFQ